VVYTTAHPVFESSIKVSPMIARYSKKRWSDMPFRHLDQCQHSPMRRRHYASIRPLGSPSQARPLAEMPPHGMKPAVVSMFTPKSLRCRPVAGKECQILP
jgi:hypothetical protein